MPDTYTLLEKVTVGAAGASSITFTNIPQSYNDLVIRMSGRTTYGSNIGDNITVTANGNAITTVRSVYGAGSGNIASVLDPFITAAALATANTFNNGEFLFSNYSGSTAKSVLFDGIVENNATAAFQFITSGMFTSTSPITSITMAGQAGGSSWVQGSTFYLYGVTRLNVTPLSAPKATGGDIIVSDGTYWIHTFLSSGTFRPLTALNNVDYLVIAGGGGGANGGGGAGGYRTSAGTSGANSAAESKLSMLANTNYTVTVGAGGANATTGSVSTLSGSGITTITSNGGGGGNSGFGMLPGQNGGSGGGARGVGNAGGTGTANQGLNGGASVNNNTTGGGGGAGQAGADSTASNGGNGGNGLASTITGTSVTRAGGGGGASGNGPGGNGGAGGGGNAEVTGVTVAGTGAINTGSGAGGGWAISTNLQGGSGIVIVRYAV